MGIINIKTIFGKRKIMTNILNYPISVNPNDYNVGVIIGRFQVHNLHEGHQELIDTVSKNHKKVIVFLGVSRVQYTERNPMDFATRMLMIKAHNPNVIVMPLEDMRSDTNWSKNVDNLIKVTLGGKKALLYGSRDSFIPYYTGKHTTVELISNITYSGSNVRKEVSEEILGTSDFRAGLIYATAQQYPVSYQTVDVAVLNGKKEILLGRKPGETNFRFIGGFVDPTDVDLETAALRELHEEAGPIEVASPEYVCSRRIDDWRYRSGKSKIMTTLFVCNYIFGKPEPNDDIEAVGWFKLSDIGKTIHIMPEHTEIMDILLEKYGE